MAQPILPTLSPSQNSSKKLPTQKNIVYSIFLHDLFLFAYFWGKQKNDKKGKLLSEANYRNTVTLSPVAFILLLMITILKDSFSRKNNIYKRTMSISLILIIQTLFIVIKNVVHDNVIFLPLMYLFPLSLIIICIILLKKNKKNSVIFIKHKSII